MERSSAEDYILVGYLHFACNTSPQKKGAPGKTPRNKFVPDLSMAGGFKLPPASQISL
jgi:hypothetical protein